MRDLSISKNAPETYRTISKTIVFRISLSLLTKCKIFIKSKHLTRDYKYSNVSDLIRKSLLSYKNKELTLNLPRPSDSAKISVSLVLTLDLWEYYQSFPLKHRTDIIESCLINYLNTL